MWRPITTVALVFLLALVSPALAQTEGAPTLRDVQLPNGMTPHTWFIIAAVGFFLLWCISYCLQLQKESLSQKPRREEYLRRKNELLDRIAELDSARDAGSLNEDRYQREFKKAKSQLSEILLRLGKDPLPPAEQ
jgi:hypothetical protein